MAVAKESPATPSTFARVGLVMYLLLIVYASLFPFTGWRDNGIAPQAFLSGPLPHYWTVFDVLTNVVGYVPFGILVAFAVYPHVRGMGAILLALVAGTLLSGSMEAAQTFLPSRVSSILDLYTNVSGSLIGGIAGVLLTPTFLEQSRFLSLRRHWFFHDAGRGLIVASLWPLAQIYPQAYLFGHGQIVPILSEWLSDWLEQPVDLFTSLQNNIDFTVEQYWLAETIITACGMAGAVLLLLVTLKPAAPRAWLAWALVGATLILKSLANALLFNPANAFSWLTPGAQGGLLFAAAMLFGLSFAPQVAQRRIAVLMLLISLIVVNLMPSNPYFMATLQSWVQGKFLNFNGAARFLSVMWPFFAFWYLLHPSHRVKRT
ncbi:VanZ family protein [Paucimonas lemoignei]|uniref:VanZ family protein n=1 Tax=Paucimonas lemoignei TaxID=29443 RepID=A0A4R3HXC9_PAULE|nr:VanZ family protein [Paucimonas lemoignei]TCS37832.1 VanZ family protein [Paucimonas lemoignei]